MRAIIRTAPTSDTIRHPSESWGIAIGSRDTRPMNIPAFAGMTGGVRVANVGRVLAAEGAVQ